MSKPSLPLIRGSAGISITRSCAASSSVSIAPKLAPPAPMHVWEKIPSSNSANALGRISIAPTFVRQWGRSRRVGPARTRCSSARCWRHAPRDAAFAETNAIATATTTSTAGYARRSVATASARAGAPWERSNFTEPSVSAGGMSAGRSVFRGTSAAPLAKFPAGDRSSPPMGRGRAASQAAGGCYPSHKRRRARFARVRSRRPGSRPKAFRARGE
jgi:hypothetical protein